MEVTPPFPGLCIIDEDNDDAQDDGANNQDEGEHQFSYADP